MSRGSDRDPFNEALRAATSEACLSPERLAELGAGVTPTARERDHLERCSTCGAEAELAASFFASAEETPEVSRIVAALEERHGGSAPTVIPFARRAPRGWRPPALVPWAAAAMVVLVTGLVTWQRAPSTPGLPPPPTVDVVRGSEIDVLPTSSRWTEMRWLAVDEAAEYVVEVRRVDGELVWRTETTQARVVLPESVASAVAPGVTLYWQVRASRRGGESIAASPTSELIRPLSE